MGTWIQILAALYREVHQNLKLYVDEIHKTRAESKSKKPYEIYLAVAEDPEIDQFIYLSKVTGVSQKIEGFDELESDIEQLQFFDVDELAKENRNSILIGFIMMAIGIIILISSTSTNIHWIVFAISVGIIAAGSIIAFNPELTSIGKEFKLLKGTIENLRKKVKGLKVADLTIDEASTLR